MGLYLTYHPAVLMYSALWGVYIYLWYEALHLFRYLLDNRKSVCVFCDILFFVGAAPALFLFALAYNFGEIRAYMLVSMIVSFLIMKLTVGKWVYYPLIKLLKSTINFSAKFIIKIKNFFAKLLKSAVFLVYNLVNKSRYRFSTKKGSH